MPSFCPSLLYMQVPLQVGILHHLDHIQDPAGFMMHCSNSHATNVDGTELLTSEILMIET